MPMYAAVDSNALTYLVNAIGVEGYDPAVDDSGLADERVAMARLFIYADCHLWVPPTVRGETADMPDEDLQRAQYRVTWFQLLDHDSGVAESVIQARVTDLLRHHSGEGDCRVLAETETMELGYLITCDKRLYRRLHDHTTVSVIRPSELWTSLDIRCAPSGGMRPTSSNPLSAVSWWRLPSC